MLNITAKFAYSKIGKAVAALIQRRFFKTSRTHWVQQAIADMDFSKLRD